MYLRQQQRWRVELTKAYRCTKDMSLSFSSALCLFSSWSKDHERTATVPLSFSFCLRSFFTQCLWLCVIRRCDTFPVAHRYPLPSQEPWHAAHSPTCLGGHNRGMPCEDFFSRPARFYNPCCHLHTGGPLGKQEGRAPMADLSFHLDSVE